MSRHFDRLSAELARDLHPTLARARSLCPVARSDVLRIVIDEIARRLHDIRLQSDADIDFHSTFNSAPLAVPITFTPGTRVGA